MYTFFTNKKYGFFQLSHSRCNVKSLALVYWSFPHASDGKESACNAGDPTSIPGSGRSPGEGNDNPFRYSCLENPMGRGAWWATVPGVTKSRTNTFHFSWGLWPDRLMAIALTLPLSPTEKVDPRETLTPQDHLDISDRVGLKSNLVLYSFLQLQPGSNWTLGF